jgi:hypothetical protein
MIRAEIGLKNGQINSVLYVLLRITDSDYPAFCIFKLVWYKVMNTNDSPEIGLKNGQIIEET